jgi:hypothetical protein
MFEHKSSPLISRRAFLSRLALALLIACGLIAVSLAAGIWGYRHFEGMNTLDAFVNASMLLSGMGPLSSLQTSGGKIFAGLYALYSGFVALIAVGMVAAPLVHRHLHKFHLDDGDGR